MIDNHFLKKIGSLARSDPNSIAGINARSQVAGALAGRPEFIGDRRTIVAIDGGHDFTPEFAASRMLKIARDTGNPNAALAWLQKVSVLSEAKGGAVSALYGVSSNVEVAFSSNLLLLPYLDLPPSPTRDFVLHREHDDFHGISRRPTVAFYRAGTVSPMFYSSGDTEDGDDADDMDEVQPSKWYGEIVDATKLLTLVPHAIPREAAHWMHYDDLDIELLGVRRLSQHWSELDPKMLFSPTPVTAESVAGVLPKYRALGVKDKDRLKLALERVDRARCQLRIGNRAIDLAIALEVLFMNVDSGEHSYKIGLRAARFLANERDERRKIFANVRKLYDIRSKMVHAGQAPDQVTVGNVKLSSYDVVQFVDGVCTRTIRRMIAGGDIPNDWSDIEL